MVVAGGSSVVRWKRWKRGRWQETTAQNKWIGKQFGNCEPSGFSLRGNLFFNLNWTLKVLKPPQWCMRQTKRLLASIHFNPMVVVRRMVGEQFTVVSNCIYGKIYVHICRWCSIIAVAAPDGITTENAEKWICSQHDLIPLIRNRLWNPLLHKTTS